MCNLSVWYHQNICKCKWGWNIKDFVWVSLETLWCNLRASRNDSFNLLNCLCYVKSSTKHFTGNFNEKWSLFGEEIQIHKPVNNLTCFRLVQLIICADKKCKETCFPCSVSITGCRSSTKESSGFMCFGVPASSSLSLNFLQPPLCFIRCFLAMLV